ncbi:hypothetical protein KSP39_PZI015464 [Platanthera zijinensis]|uniref:Uncharacterized protein n=1 Tax=Platanthera zijinensis TaxID=2320716 RepID=A0AAP0B8T6_9ASPA
MMKRAQEETSRLETELGAAKAQVEALSFDSRVSELKVVGLTEYMESLDYMRDQCLISEEVREEIWSKEVQPQIEDVLELALRCGVSKLFVLLAGVWDAMYPALALMIFLATRVLMLIRPTCSDAVFLY